MRTQVAIVGGGPSGLLLGQLLHRTGIDNIVIEKHTQAYVLQRIRAGVLESRFVELLREAGVADRLEKEGLVHDGTGLSFDNERLRIDFRAHTGVPVIVYGQTEVTRDLYEARTASGARTVFEAANVAINGADTDTPSVTYQAAGTSQTITCDFVAGCDGFHGVSRPTIPATVRREFEKSYPFGWLGVLSETPPVDRELIYSSSTNGFALCSMRNENLSRYYIQCATSDHPDDWSDTAFWDELKRRLPEDAADQLVTGPSIEKSIAPLRSFVSEPMQWGRLFLCGDAAHIVPPTGAKGLNTAGADVNYLFQALRHFYRDNDTQALDTYSQMALARVWKAERFSWWMTTLLHRFPDQSAFDGRMQQAEFEFLRSNTSAQAALAANYVGLPY
ncbi:MAG: 4-hydroxybenzoate 3-monooxygenase [Hyphomicrobiaceae bacterium]